MVNILVLEFVESSGIWLMAFLGGTALAVRLACQLPKGVSWTPRRSSFAAAESASAVLEFLLVFPILAMIILIVVQVAMVLQARLVVGYAAYASCRSAIVWLEEGLSAARERSKRAASIACLAISPARSDVSGVARLPAPLLVHGGDSGALGRRLSRAGRKLRHADQATDVEISCPVDLGPHTPVTATVEHRFHLSVPYAGWLLSRLVGTTFRGLPVVPITDSYTLLHEGRVETTAEGRDLRGRPEPRPWAS